MTNDLVALIANVSLALSFHCRASVWYHTGYAAAARDRRERLTLDTLSSFQTREFAELIHYVTTSRFSLQPRRIADAAGKRIFMLIQFAQEMESLGILVAERLINIDLVDKTLGSLVTTCWEKYKTFFMDIREKQPDPFLGEYFQWLAEQIDYRMKKNPRKPFFETNIPGSAQGLVNVNVRPVKNLNFVPQCSCASACPIPVKLKIPLRTGQLE